MCTVYVIHTRVPAVDAGAARAPAADAGAARASAANAGAARAPAVDAGAARAPAVDAGAALYIIINELLFANSSFLALLPAVTFFSFLKTKKFTCPGQGKLHNGDPW